MHHYHPGVVAQAFMSMEELHPGRVFLGAGSGETLCLRSGFGKTGGARKPYSSIVHKEGPAQGVQNLNIQ